MKLLVCGDRKWLFPEVIRHYLMVVKPELVIEGEATGADRQSRLEADKLNIPVMRFPAKWTQFGKAAGTIRNQQMLDEGQPTHVLACHADIVNSKGTKDMIIRSLKHNLIVTMPTGIEWYPFNVQYIRFATLDEFNHFLLRASERR